MRSGVFFPRHGWWCDGCEYAIAVPGLGREVGCAKWNFGQLKIALAL